MNVKNLSFLTKAVFCTFSWCIGMHAMSEGLPAAWLTSELSPITEGDLREFTGRKLLEMANVLRVQKELVNSLREVLECGRLYDEAVRHIEEIKSPNCTLYSNGFDGHSFNAACSLTDAFLLKCTGDFPKETEEKKKVDVIRFILEQRRWRLSPELRSSLWWQLAELFDRKRFNISSSLGAGFDSLKEHFVQDGHYSEYAVLCGYAYPLAAYNRAVSTFKRKLSNDPSKLLDYYAQIVREKRAIIAWYDRSHEQIDKLQQMMLKLYARIAGKS